MDNSPQFRSKFLHAQCVRQKLESKRSQQTGSNARIVLTQIGLIRGWMPETKKSKKNNKSDISARSVRSTTPAIRQEHDERFDTNGQATCCQRPRDANPRTKPDAPHTTLLQTGGVENTCIYGVF